MAPPIIPNTYWDIGQQAGNDFLDGPDLKLIPISESVIESNGLVVCCVVLLVDSIGRPIFGRHEAVFSYPPQTL